MPDNYAVAAARHFYDAEKLADCNRFDNAGHLIGFAAECALKSCLENLHPHDNAPHVHFPQLIEKAKKVLHGRRTSSMYTLLKQQNYLDGWTVADRYSNDKIQQEIYQRWRVDASKALSIASIRVQK